MNSLKLILTNYKYFAPVWVFTSLNILIGTWVLYIPNVKLKLNLNDAELGLALFSYALGILVFLPLVPYLNKKIGTGKFTIIGILLFALSFIFPLLATNYILLCISLFITGIFSGTTDITMNALISQIEQSANCNIMSASHGFFSLGGVIGGGLGSLLISYYKNPLWHMLLIIVFILITNIVLAKHYYTIKERKNSEKKSRFTFKKLKPLIGISFIAFVIMASEGAIEHWSSLYLKEIESLKSISLYGLGFVIFSTTMMLGRFFGDRISKNISSNKIIIYGCIVAIFGYSAILTNTINIVLTGFGILGLGLSVIIPELFRIAGKTKGISSSYGISFVSGIGFIGFLAGPVVLGFISNYSNLKSSFILLLLLVLLAFCISLLRLKNKRANNV